MRDSLSRAERRAESAEETLRRNDYGQPDESRRRFAAEEAASDLRDGANAIADARFGLDRILGPFREHDRLRFRVEDLTATAADKGERAAKVGGVGSKASKAADVLADTTASVDATMQSLVPGAPVTQISDLLAQGVTNAKTTAIAARTVKTPRHFAMKVAAAYGVTLGVPAGGAAGGYLAYRKWS
jgi:hypothetical protein